MKRSHFMTMLLAGVIQTAAAATYTDLSKDQCDEANKVIYDGKGSFRVKSAGTTDVEVQININSLHSYVNSNDYRSGSPLMLWDTNAAQYGLADITDMSKQTGEREPEICFFWKGNVWKPQIRIPYATLQQFAVNGIVKLKLSNNPTKGVRVLAEAADETVKELLVADGLKSSQIKETRGYKINLNYVTAFSINSPSSLDTAGYEAPKDYTAPYTKQKTGQETLGRVMFLGDSITHGVNDQTWRWQLFKILVDNGIEAEIVGPREGYTPGYTNLTTSDAGNSYGGVHFPNVHLAQSSGRTHNIISGSNAGMSGVNYGGHSTKSSADSFNCDTWCCLMGTNDLLSDRGYTAADFAKKMQNILGGKVTAKGGKYSRTSNKEWGNMGTIAGDILREKSDVLYVMAVPCWGNHGNNNEPERHLAVKNHNALLKEWCVQYAKKHDKRVLFVDVNKGMVDPTLTPFSWPDSMSNKPGHDGLHPNEQGSLIIAGNLAKAMGIPGRTAGLPRQAATNSWQTCNISAAASKGNKGRSAGSTLKKGADIRFSDISISAEKGYSAELTVRIGGGGTPLPHDKGLSLSIGDGSQGGTLHFSEGSILWDGRVLYSPEKGKKISPEPVRIVWHPGKAEHNIPQGFYVWYGDMLIGQGLPAQSGAESGIRLHTNGTQATVSRLYWTDSAYAPAAKTGDKE